MPNYLFFHKHRGKARVTWPPVFMLRTRMAWDLPVRAFSASVLKCRQLSVFSRPYSLLGTVWRPSSGGYKEPGRTVKSIPARFPTGRKNSAIPAHEFPTGRKWRFRQEGPARLSAGGGYRFPAPRRHAPQKCRNSRAGLNPPFHSRQNKIANFCN